MNKAKRIDLLHVLQARAEARALLFRCAEYGESGEATVPLLVWAIERGLVEAYGRDPIVAIINEPFKDLIRE